MKKRRILFVSHFGTRTHSAWREIIEAPPDGYEFVIHESGWDRLFNALVMQNEWISANPALHRVINRLIPPRLVKALLDAKLRPPMGADVAFCVDHVAPRAEPWVLFVSWPSALLGSDYRHVRRFRVYVEKILLSESCKKILTWSEYAKSLLLRAFPVSQIEGKVEVIPLALRPRPFSKHKGSGKLKLLFVGTVNNPAGRVARLLGDAYFWEFHGKGGKEVLEAFGIVSERYQNVELVVRAAVPPGVRRKWSWHSRIRWIDNPVPRQALEREFETSDIFVYPSHQMTPWTVFLEAMNYELPIVTTDLYANGEIVRHGVTGYLIKVPSGLPYYWEGGFPSMGTPLERAYRNAILSGTSAQMVAELAKGIGELIEDERMRREMGRRGRAEVEQGRHSILRRNAILKRVLDEALGLGG